MRSRPGTTSLRCLLYIDELFGYLPPVAEPPSKRPLLTLLKQARAFGLGIVLATQNPVDLDYKGLSNTGTWFLGRLQTERDKERVLEGLQGASAEAGEALDRRQISDILSQLDQRVFLMHNVHEDRPAVFQTRWALSYLAGPMTRNQIRSLRARSSADVPATEAPTGAGEGRARTPETRPPSHALAKATEERRPVLPPDLPEVFLPLPLQSPRGGEQVVYEPAVIGSAEVHFVDTRRGLSADETRTLLAEVNPMSREADWNASRRLTMVVDQLQHEPQSGARFAPLPTSMAQVKQIKAWQQSLANHLYRSERYRLLRSPDLGEYSRPGENERDFRIRLAERSREERDRKIEQLREQYAAKLRATEERIRRAEEAVEREAQQAASAKVDTAISFGATLLRTILGRKRFSSTNVGRAASTARGMGRASKQTDDVRRAEARLFDHQQDLQDLEQQIEQEIQELLVRYDPLRVELESVELKPRRRDINVRLVAVAWVPGELDDRGQIQPLV
jgi:hypothetical protein